MIENVSKDDFSPALLKEKFIEIYGRTDGEIRIFASPARINIIGEHIDYNGGKVFPAAIDKYLYVALRKRSDSKITYTDLKFPGVFTFDINDIFSYKKERRFIEINMNSTEVIFLN